MKPIEEAALETAAELAESLNLNPVPARIFALLFFSADPVSLDEIASKLKLSHGSADGHLRILEEWSAIRKNSVPGSRKEFYSAEPDLMKIVLGRLEEGLSRKISLADGKFLAIRKLAREDGDKKSGSFYAGRLKKLEQMKEFAQSALKLLPMARNPGTLKLLTSFLKK